MKLRHSERGGGGERETVGKKMSLLQTSQYLF